MIQIVLWMVFVIYFIAGSIYSQMERKKYKVRKLVSAKWSFSVKHDLTDFIFGIVGILITVGLIFATENFILNIIVWVLFLLMLFQFFVSVWSQGKPEKSEEVAEKLYFEELKKDKIITNSKDCPFKSSNKGCRYGNLPSDDDSLSGRFIFFKNYCEGTGNPGRVRSMIQESDPDMLKKFPSTQRSWHYCVYIFDRVKKDEIKIK